MAKSRGRKLAELVAPTNGVFAAASIPTIALSKLASSTFSVNSESASLGGNVVLDSNDITEHTSALYFTNARADSRADVRIAAHNLLARAGGTMTGNLTLGDNVNAYFGASTDLRIYHDGTNSHIINSTGELRFTGSNFAIKSDSAKLYLGAGDDLQIYHDGSHSFISDQGTGHLKLLAGDFRLNNAADNAQMISAVSGGAVYLFHNNAVKLTTTSTGIDVTGSTVTDGLLSTGAITVDHSDGTDNISLTPTSTGGVLNVRNSSATSVIALDGRNSQVTIAGFASMATGAATSKFAVGTTGVHGSYDFYNNGTSYFNGAVTVDDNLNANSLTVNSAFTFPTSDGSANQILQTNGSGTLSWVTNSGGSSVWSSSGSDIYYTSGEVGIGTNNPSAPLHVVGSDSGIKISSSTSDRPHLSLVNGTTEVLRLSANANYGAIGDSTSGQRYMVFKSGKVGIGTDNPGLPLTLQSGENKTMLLNRTASNEPANLNEFSSYYSLGIVNRDSGSYLNFGGGSAGTKIQATDGAGSATAKYISLNPYGGSIGIGIGNSSPSKTLEVTGEARINKEATINTTTPGTTATYGLHFGGQATADSATGITFSAGNTTQTNANAGIYVQGSGSYGTKMYLATTDSYATGAKTALQIDHTGLATFIRQTPKVNANVIWHAGNDGSGSGLDADTVDGVQASALAQLSSSNSFTNTYNEFGNNTGAVSNDGSWHARVNISGTSHARLDLYEDGDDSKLRFYVHTGYNPRIDTASTSALDFGTAGVVRMTIPSNSGVVTTTGQGTLWGSSNDGSGSGLDADLWDGNQFSSYLNQAVKTNSNVTFNDVYANDWFRNNNAGEGLYNQSTSSHFYSAGSNYWHINSSSSATSSGLIFYGAYNSSQGNATNRKGYIYWDGGGFGLLSSDGSWAYRHNNTNADIYGNNIRHNATNIVWHAGNDGSGSGLDADLLDGLNSDDYARLGNYNSTFGGTPSSSNIVRFDNASGQSMNSSTAYLSRLECRQGTAGADAFMSFHVAGDYGAYFGLDGATNDFSVGGWSMGANKYKVWHAGNDGPSSDLFSQFTNTLVGAGGISNAVGSNGVEYSGQISNGVTGLFNASNNANGILRLNTHPGHYYHDLGFSSDGSMYHRSFNASNAFTTTQWNKVWTASNDGSGSGLDADTLDGLQLHTGTNNEANKVVRTDSNGYANFGWINSTSGDEGSTVPNRIYASSDGYIRYLDLASFRSRMNVTAKTGYQGRESSTTDTNYWVGTMGWGTTTFENLFKYGSGSIDTWSNPSDQPSGTSHWVGSQHLHYHNGSTGRYGQQIVVGAGNPSLMYVRGAWGGNFSSWRKIWNDGNDGSGSGLDADLLDGLNSGQNGGNIVLRTNANGYLNLANWLNITTYGIYSSTTNSAHFTPNQTTSYGTWSTSGSKGGYDGIMFNSGGDVAVMFDGSGNGGFYREPGGGWYTYFNVSNNCLGINSSTTSSSYGAYVDGALYSTANIVAYSDRRIKENIVPIDNALEKVNKLAGVYYNKIDDETKTREIGFIAQDVNEVTPELVTYAEDVDQYGVKYGNTTALLVEAVKELTQQVKDLKQELEELKNG